MYLKIITPDMKKKIKTPPICQREIEQLKTSKQKKPEKPIQRIGSR